MQDKRFNAIMGQYFPGAQVTSMWKPSVTLHEAKPLQLDEPDVQAKVCSSQRVDLGHSRLGTTASTAAPARHGLKLGCVVLTRRPRGYHGSVHTKKMAERHAVLLRERVFADARRSYGERIVAFDQSWKNVVATLYHELNEFRTDADVKERHRIGQQ